jgi:hypothetical protein
MLENDTPEKERENKLKTVIESASPRDMNNHNLFREGLTNLAGILRSALQK